MNYIYSHVINLCIKRRSDWKAIVIKDDPIYVHILTGTYWKRKILFYELKLNALIAYSRKMCNLCPPNYAMFFYESPLKKSSFNISTLFYWNACALIFADAHTDRMVTQRHGKLTHSITSPAGLTLGPCAPSMRSKVINWLMLLLLGFVFICPQFLCAA